MKLRPPPRRKGQAIVEMSLLLPILLLVVVGGLIDFGFAFYNAITLHQIAEDVAREMADNTPKGDTPSTSQAQSLVNQHKPTWWEGPLTSNIVYPVPIPGFPSSSGFRVVVTYKTPIYTPFWGGLAELIAGAPYLPLAAQATYRLPQHQIRH